MYRSANFRIRRWAVLAAVLASAAGCGGPEGPDATAGDESALPLTAPAPIYADALGSGWSDWSWATDNLANASPVAAGTRSIAVDFGPWTGLYFHNAAVSTSGLSDLTLYVNGGNTAGKQLVVCATVGGTQRTKVPLARYCEGGTIPANAWTRCRVPLSAMAVANTTIDGVVLQEWAGKTLSRTYVDSVSFTASTATSLPSAPTGVTATVSAGVVSLSWGAVSGATGYEVYRSNTQTGTAANLTAAPLTTTAYSDAAVSAGSTYWYSVAAVSSAGEGPRSAAVSASVPTTTTPTVSVMVSPSSATLAPGGTQQFSAAVSGATNTGTTWTVLEGASGGAVTSTGLYTAPSTAGTYHVVATSVADPTRTATSTVVVSATGGGTVSVVPAARSTTWRPGIQSDDQLGLPLGPDGLPQRTTVCATLSPGANIQAAIDACPAGQVVQLNAGTFSVSSTVTLTRGVVLRGSGYQGAPAGTTIVKTGGGTVLAIGTGQDGTCYDGTAYGLTADAAKGSSTVTVGSAAANFAAGDIALLDVVDDATIQQGDCSYYKRVSGRSASQRVEVKAVDASRGTLTLASPLHWTFKAGGSYQGQVTRAPRTTVKWAGIEHLRIQGGSNPGYNGEMAGGIDISNAAYCWVKDVQTDGTIGGMHVSLTGTHHCVVRDSFLHHSSNYGFGADCYGVVLRCGAADNLVENNIVRWMNKPILFNASGGGNVIGYNYADNSWSSPAAYQEVNIDSHCAFPHMELMEGNWAPHMGASTTHGNAGYLTYYRNYASSKFASPAVYGSTATQWQNVTALQFDAGDIGMNVVGNVLGTAGLSTTYDGYDINLYNVFQLGANGGGANDVAATSLYRNGNFDTVHNATVWDPSVTDRTLPPSLYLSAKPGWWPAGTPWPWTGPDLSPMVGTLPAKARSDASP